MKVYAAFTLLLKAFPIRCMITYTTFAMRHDIL